MPTLHELLETALNGPVPLAGPDGTTWSAPTQTVIALAGLASTTRTPLDQDVTVENADDNGATVLITGAARGFRCVLTADPAQVQQLCATSECPTTPAGSTGLCAVHLPGSSIPAAVQEIAEEQLRLSELEAALAGRMSTPGPDDSDSGALWNLEQAGAYMGFTGPSAAQSAYRVLKRGGFTPAGRAPGRGGGSLYRPTQIITALATRPGRGRRTDLHNLQATEQTAEQLTTGLIDPACVDPALSREILSLILTTLTPEERAAYPGQLEEFAEQHRDRITRLYRDHGPGSANTAHGRYQLLAQPAGLAVCERLDTNPLALASVWADALPGTWLNDISHTWTSPSQTP
ncbi:hypothetical protein [Streptomyces jumonjinensis]|uniref:Uncharacterized protein n=1 Tax=Streptomyces jumonjinensis TaxID=1945 RepID=A0A646KMX2_STRJU|nr:hypothetical protein [Streptomyces jumonjinensis]MQT03583.1 hypothetical protein [Streptomyces jumonjinensis]